MVVQCGLDGWAGLPPVLARHRRPDRGEGAGGGRGWAGLAVGGGLVPPGQRRLGQINVPAHLHHSC